jgi:hypothetical protein
MSITNNDEIKGTDLNNNNNSSSNSKKIETTTFSNVVNGVKQLLDTTQKEGIRSAIKKYAKMGTDRFIDFAVDRVADRLCSSVLKVQSIAILNQQLIQLGMLSKDLGLSETTNIMRIAQTIQSMHQQSVVRTDAQRYPWVNNAGYMRAFPQSVWVWNVFLDTNFAAPTQFAQCPIYCILPSLNSQLAERAPRYNPKPAILQYGALFDGSDPGVVMRALDTNIDNYDMGVVSGMATMTGPALKDITFSATELYTRLILYANAMSCDVTGFPNNLWSNYHVQITAPIQCFRTTAANTTYGGFNDVTFPLNLTVNTAINVVACNLADFFRLASNTVPTPAVWGPNFSRTNWGDNCAIVFVTKDMCDKRYNWLYFLLHLCYPFRMYHHGGVNVFATVDDTEHRYNNGVGDNFSYTPTASLVTIPGPTTYAILVVIDNFNALFQVTLGLSAIFVPFIQNAIAPAALGPATIALTDDIDFVTNSIAPCFRKLQQLYTNVTDFHDANVVATTMMTWVAPAQAAVYDSAFDQWDYAGYAGICEGTGGVAATNFEFPTFINGQMIDAISNGAEIASRFSCILNATGMIASAFGNVAVTNNTLYYTPNAQIIRYDPVRAAMIHSRMYQPTGSSDWIATKMTGCGVLALSITSHLSSPIVASIFEELMNVVGENNSAWFAQTIQDNNRAASLYPRISHMFSSITSTCLELFWPQNNLLNVGIYNGYYNHPTAAVPWNAIFWMIYQLASFHPRITIEALTGINSNNDTKPEMINITEGTWRSLNNQTGIAPFNQVNGSYFVHNLDVKNDWREEVRKLTNRTDWYHTVDRSFPLEILLISSDTFDQFQTIPWMFLNPSMTQSVFITWRFFTQPIQYNSHVAVPIGGTLPRLLPWDLVFNPPQVDREAHFCMANTSRHYLKTHLLIGVTASMENKLSSRMEALDIVSGTGTTIKDEYD